jgi:ABC-type multidrug transport system permease subunit
MHGSPRNWGDAPIAGPKSSKDRFGRYPDQGEFEFNHERIFNMLYTIAVVLIILWLLGLVTSYTMGGFIHILLIIAIVVILLRVISGRRPL